MRIENRSLSGALIFVGVAQHMLVIAIAEALHPGYTVATNYLSDLGVGQTALMYNASAVVFGGFVLIGSLVGRRTSAQALPSPLRSPAPVPWGRAYSLKPPARPM